jgi:hypothetical protein
MVGEFAPHIGQTRAKFKSLTLPSPVSAWRPPAPGEGLTRYPFLATIAEITCAV